jgi:UPF0716 protein FxsA
VVVLLFVLFIVVPILELAVIVQVSGAIGVLATIALLLGIGMLGSWLVKYQGLGVLRRMQTTLGQGDLPARELVDGVLVLFAGALLLTPGFLTDVLGIVLLVPPTRAMVRTVLLRRFRHRLEAELGFMVPGAGRATGSSPGFTAGRVHTGRAVYDVVDVDEAPARPSPGVDTIELGPGT